MPDFNQWLSEARKLNPGATDSDLRGAFETDFGPPEPKTTDFYEKWAGEVRRLNPQASESDIKSAFLEDYGVPPVEPPGFFETLGGVTSDKFTQAKGALALTAGALGAIEPEDAEKIYQETLKDETFKPDELAQFYKNLGDLSEPIGAAWEAGDYGTVAAEGMNLLGQGLWELVSNPKGTAYALAEQAPMLLATYAPGLAAGAAGSAVGGPVGGAIGFLAGSATGEASIEAAFKIRELIEERSLDPENPQDVLTVLRDKEALAGIVESGKIKGLTVASVDLAANVLGLKLLKGIKNTAEGGIDVTSAIGRTAGASGLQSLAGGGGEVGGEYLATGQADWREFGPEAILEIPGGFLDVAATGYGLRQLSQQREQAKLDALEALKRATNVEQAVKVAANYATLEADTDIGLSTLSEAPTPIEARSLESIFRKQQPLTLEERNDLAIDLTGSAAERARDLGPKFVAEADRRPGRIANRMPADQGTPVIPKKAPLFPDEIRPKSGFYDSQVQAEQALANKLTTRDPEKQAELKNYIAVESETTNGQWYLKKASKEELSANQTQAEEVPGAAEGDVLSYNQALTQLRAAPGWGMRRAGEGLKSLSPVSGAGSLARFDSADVAALVEGDVKLAPRVKKDEGRVEVPTPESDRLNLPYGRVERAVESKLKAAKGDLDGLNTRRLSNIMWAPKPRKGKEKLDKQVRPRGFSEIREMYKWAKERDQAIGWYKEFGDGMRKIVGDRNMQEASIIFGITSAQNSAEANLANTLHIMRLARQYDPVKEPAKFKNAVRTIKRPDGQGMLVGGPAIDSIIRAYQKGTYEGGLKISNYMQTVKAGARNEFAPYSVQDVHMARVFGYMYKDVDKDTGQVVDTAKFPSDGAIRYAQMLTGLLAKEQGVKPNETQALLWFYAKTNLSPKKTTGKPTKSGIGAGTWQSAEKYSKAEIDAIVADIRTGAFDTENAFSESLKEEIPPANTMVSLSDRWSNRNLNVAIEYLAKQRAPSAVVSLNPGNARGYGFPADATLEDLLEYHHRVLRAITDDDGQIKVLREAGVVHEVGTILGTWDRMEPSLHITFPGETMETATWAAELLGHATMQDAAITEQPNFSGQNFIVQVQKKGKAPFTGKEIDKIYADLNPDKSSEGINLSTSPDLTKIKFLDARYYEGDYTGDMLKEFLGSISKSIGASGYDYGMLSQDGNYIDFTGADSVSNEKASRRYLFPTRDTYPSKGSPGIQRTAIDTLYKPIWGVYKRFIGAKGYEQSNQRSPLQELRGSPRFSPRALSDGRAPTPGGRVTEATKRIQEALGVADGSILEVAVPGPLRGFVSQFVEEVLGKKAIFIKNTSDFKFNGFALDQTTLYVDEDADAPHMAVIGHELLHTIRRSDPKVYNDLKATLTPLLDDYSPYRDFVNSPRRKGGFPDVTEDTLIEELIADMVGDSFMDDAFWNRVQLANPSVFERILTAVKDFMDSLVAYMGGQPTLRGTTYFRDYTRARDKVADTLSSHIADRIPPQPLDWIKLSQTVTIQDTGEIVTLVQKASDSLDMSDERLAALEKLGKCLSA